MNMIVSAAIVVLLIVAISLCVTPAFSSDVPDYCKFYNLGPSGVGYKFIDCNMPTGENVHCVSTGHSYGGIYCWVIE